MVISDFGYVPEANVNNYPTFSSAALDCIRQALGT